MRQSFPRLARTLVTLVAVVGIMGCSEYWWTRGQPPSVGTLIARSQARLQTALKDHGQARQNLAPRAEKLQTSLTSALTAIKQGDGDAVNSKLEDVVGHFIGLEGHLSSGSQPPYGELSGQLRAFQSQAVSGEKLDYSAFGLLAARTMFFLANEMGVPGPAVG